MSFLLQEISGGGGLVFSDLPCELTGSRCFNEDAIPKKSQPFSPTTAALVQGLRMPFFAAFLPAMIPCHAWPRSKFTTKSESVY